MAASRIAADAPCVRLVRTTAHGGSALIFESMSARSPMVRLPPTKILTRLLQWYRDGHNVMARLPLLSTYLGHACVSDTEVYLHITTALLEEANTRFHAFAHDLFPAPGGE